MAAPCSTFQSSPCSRFLKAFLLNQSFATSYLCRKYSNKKRQTPRQLIQDPRQNSHYIYSHNDALGRDQLIADDVPFPSSNENKAKIWFQASKIKEKRYTQFGHVFEKLKGGDLQLGRIILNAKSRKEGDTILLEGQRLIKDALLLGAKLKKLYFCDDEILKELKPSMLEDTHIFKIIYKDMRTWSGTTTPSGIMGVFKKPQQGEVYSYTEPRLPLTLILDGIKDPGNVGTLVRTAAAVGCQQVLALKGCVDLWEGKVLRSGMAGHFSVPVYTDLSWSQVYGYMSERTKVFLAEARTESEVLKGFDPSLTAELVEEQVSASLKRDDTDSSSESSSDSGEEDEESVPDYSPQQTLYSSVPFPVIPYHKMLINQSCSNTDADDARSSGDEVALVMGSETRGLSSSAKKFAYDHYGTFVTIPMNPSVDSLNTAVAGSVIMYEIQRKLLS